MTVLASLSEIASQQAASSENIMKKVNYFLDYMASNPHAIIRYYVSDMALNWYSNTSYLTTPNARSRANGIFSLAPSHATATPSSYTEKFDTVHHFEMPRRPAAAAKAELRALFLNGMEADLF